jgi:hypothetical protein
VCDKSCGVGKQSRTHTVVKAAAHGGDACPESEQRVCNTAACPIDCLVSGWSAFSECTESCGLTGTKSRSRTITRATQHGGKACVGATEGWTQTHGCNRFDCAVDCRESGWSEYGACSVTCGGGRKHRSKSVITAAAHGGSACKATHPDEYAGVCSPSQCPINCKLSEWGAFGECSRSCGNGVHRRARSIITFPAYGGNICDDTEETANCNSGLLCSGFKKTPATYRTISFSLGFKDSVTPAYAQNVLRATGMYAKFGDSVAAVHIIGISGRRLTAAAKSAKNDDGKTYNVFRISVVTKSAGSAGALAAFVVGGSFKTVLGGFSAILECKDGVCTVINVPIDCEITGFGASSECSATCGLNGVQSMSPVIARPRRFGGQRCPPSQQRACNTDIKCPVDCVVTGWSGWSSCGKSCGGGTSTRTRSMLVAPTYAYEPEGVTDRYTVPAGKACPSPFTQHEGCNTHACPVDCVVSGWSVWGSCSHTCGAGTQRRSRSISTTAANGGIACTAVLDAARTCPAQDPCAVDCEVSEWGDWSTCTKSCGGGASRSRARSIITPTVFTGKACGSLESFDWTCGSIACPIDCIDSGWDWHATCSEPCGSAGVQRAVKATLRPAQYGGKACPTAEKVVPCNSHPCTQLVSARVSVDMRLQFDTASLGEPLPLTDPVAMASRLLPAIKAATLAHPEVNRAIDWANIGWTNIGAATTCTTGRTSTASTWACVDFPLKLLLHDASQVPNVKVILATQAEMRAHLRVTDHTAAAKTRHLSPAHQFQRRVLGSLGITASNAALSSVTSAVVVIVANDIVDCALSSWSLFPVCSRSCGGHSEVHRARSVVTTAAFGGKACGAVEDSKNCMSDFACPIDCVLSEWSGWAVCSAECGGGTQSRSKRSITAARYGGKACGTALDSRNCNTKPCPVHCRFAWNEWTDCDKSCGGGEQSRSHEVITAAAHGGDECPSHEERVCKTSACPVDCVQSAWSTSGACSKSCNTGTKTKTRSTIAPANHGGNSCGTAEVSTSCNSFQCAEDCEMSAWGTWSGCDRTCGLGTDLRTRFVVSPARHGGSACEHLADARECKLVECPIHCAVSGWSAWSVCSKTCGTDGIHRHARSVITPAAFGGRTCPDIDTMAQVKSCNTFQCPVDCKVSAWSTWGQCSVKCGEGGLRDRTRTVLTRANANGAACPALTSREPCVGVQCPIDCVHEWSAWQTCSVSCAGGEQARTVLVKVYPKHGGVPCPFTQKRVCQTQACPTPAPTASPTPSPTPPPTPAWSKPVVAVLGDDVVTVEVTMSKTAAQLDLYRSRLLAGQGYAADPGATCSDPIWGDLSGSLKVVGAVNPSVVGEYTLHYHCTNPKPWAVSAEAATRKVLVVDTQCPQCIVEGDTEMSVEASFPFKDSGAQCNDLGRPLTVHTIGTVDVEARGEYVLTYRAVDTNGHASDGVSGCVGGKSCTRTVTVIDTLKPVIQLSTKTGALLKEAEAESLEIAKTSATDTSQSSFHQGMSNPAASHFDSVIEALQKKLAALTEGDHPRTTTAAAAHASSSDELTRPAGVEGIEVGTAPWLKPNPSDWSNPRNLQKSYVDCRSMCHGLAGCRFGTFISKGARKGECWLSGTAAEKPGTCAESCTSFEVSGRRLRGAARGGQ